MYGKKEGGNVDYEIIKCELAAVIHFFSFFSTDNLHHCVIAEHIKDIAQRANYSSKDALAPFLRSRKYTIYNILRVNHRKRLDLGYQKYQEWHKNQVQELVQNYKLPEFQYLLQVCKESLNITEQGVGLLSAGIECAIAAFAKDRELFIDVVKAYMDADTPYNIRVDNILHNLFAMMPAKEVKTLIMSRDFSQKNTWMWQFYVQLPEEQLSAEWVDGLLAYLQAPSTNLRLSPLRPLDEIKKYEAFQRFENASESAISFISIISIVIPDSLD